MEDYDIEITFNGYNGQYRTNTDDLEELLEIYSSFFNVDKDLLEIRFITKEYFEEED